MRPAVIAGTTAVACCLAAGAVAAGPGGLFVAGCVLAALGLVITRVGVPPAAPMPSRGARRAHGVAGDGARPFAAYRRIREALGWAGVSARHYDLATRPVLQRLLAARLAERHGIDPVRSPDRARALVGADLWPLLDPARPASADSGAPGIDMATLHRLVDRLEEL